MTVSWSCTSRSRARGRTGASGSCWPDSWAPSPVVIPRLSSRVVSTIVPGTGACADRARRGPRPDLRRRRPAPGKNLGLEPGGSQRADEGFVGHGGCLLPPEPSCRGALAGWRARIVVRRDQEVAQVKVGVTVGGAVHVHMDEPGSSVGMCELEARLLLGLTEGCRRGLLSRLEVPAGLQPSMQAFVHV